VVAALAAVSLALLAAGVTRAMPAAVTAAVTGVAACWAISAWARGAEAPAGTALVAAAALVTAELAFASVEQAAVADEPELVARRLAGIAGRAVGALVLAAVLLAFLDLSAGGGLVLEVVGVAAAVAVLLLVRALVREAAR
jgi:hypothetical protein